MFPTPKKKWEKNGYFWEMPKIEKMEKNGYFSKISIFFPFLAFPAENREKMKKWIFSRNIHFFSISGFSWISILFPFFFRVGKNIHFSYFWPRTLQISMFFFLWFPATMPPPHITFFVSCHGFSTRSNLQTQIFKNIIMTCYVLHGWSFTNV